MERITLSQVPRYSFYVKRSLQAIDYGADDARMLAMLEERTKAPVTREMMVERLAGCETGEFLADAMRRLRRDVMIALIARDTTGLADFEEVVRTMSDLAEVTVSAAVRVHSRDLARRYGVPTSAEGVPQDLLVVGMGKLGGRELNVSSDIDLIFVYDEAGDTKPTAEFPDARKSVSNHEFFERLAKRVIPAINDVEGVGFVFRVDMRLRPFGDGGPIVVSRDMLEEYLYAEGRDWERFAWLKGRVVNDPVFMTAEAFDEATKGLRSLVRPFVFRKYVDFSALSSLTRMHEMIRAETARREAGKEPGINVKLGRGGIREIEFITQTFQIMRGGREPQLRGRSTLPMLAALAEDGAVTEETAEKLSRDYVFLRNLEHALQYVDDRQTQMLMDDAETHEKIAAMLGMTREALDTRLDDVRHFTAQTFDGIFHIESGIKTRSGWPVGWEAGDDEAQKSVAEKLTGLGYKDADALAARMMKLLNSRWLASRTPQQREQFANFMAATAEKCPEWATSQRAAVAADEVFQRYLSLLEVILGRPTYIALLNQYPSAAARVGKLLAVSRWAADYLTVHPLLLDELVDGRGQSIDNYTPVDWSQWSETLRSGLLELGDDREQQMNLLRDTHHGALFHLLLADLAGRLTIERLADHLSALADAVIELVLEFAWESVPNHHCEQPHFAVIAYGKLGGKELGYASDLDLIFLYDDADSAADADYSKLVRRMLSWLTVQTSSGILFDIDMRLRPNGQNGLTVSSLEMFKRYQRNDDGNGAWFWEHQALTRARFCAGDPDVGRAFEEERRHILMLERDPAVVAKEVAAMRAKMLEGHPNTTELFDIKHDRGGMVDVEFIVQMLVLTYAHRYPQLVNNFGNILLLEMAADLGLVAKDTALAAVAAYRRYRSIQREVRLTLGAEGGPVRVPFEELKPERTAVLTLWKSLFGE